MSFLTQLQNTIDYSSSFPHGVARAVALLETNLGRWVVQKNQCDRSDDTRLTTLRPIIDDNYHEAINFVLKNVRQLSNQDLKEQLVERINDIPRPLTWAPVRTKYRA
jgi:hypothetical protein